MFGIDDAALALLVAGGLSTAGALYTNAKNRKLQGNVNDASINLANTAHQREVLDLMQAGINPILTAGGSGASVPQLNAAQVDNPTQGLADSIGQSAKYVSQQYKLNNALTAADTQLTAADAVSAQVDSHIKQQDQVIADKTYDFRKGIAIEQVEAENMKAQADHLRANADLSQAEAERRALEEMSRDQYESYIKNLREGLIASAKNAANANWRENARIGVGIANSAANVWSAIRSGRGMPVNLEEVIENFDRNGRSTGRSIRTRRGR